MTGTSARDVRAAIRRWPWGLILFLHVIFLLANVEPRLIPYPTHEAASVDSIETARNEGMLGRRVAFLLLGATAIATLAAGDARRLRINGVLGSLMIAFVLWSLLSIVWADDVTYTARRLFVFGLLWTGALWVSLRLSFVNLLRFSFISNVLTWATSLACEVAFGVFRPWESGYRFAGLYHPNEAGQCLGVALVASIALAHDARRRIRVLYICAALGAVIFLPLTGSRTAILSTLCAMLAYLAIRALRSRTYLGWLTVSVALIISAACTTYLLVGHNVADGLVSALTLGRPSDELSTLTMRTPMWKVVIHKYIAARPLTGYGYGAFWTMPHIVAMSLLRPGIVYYHSHSGYLEMALSIGIGGALVHVLTIIISAFRMARGFIAGRPACAFAFSILVMLLVSMLTEILNMSTYLMPTFTAMVIIAKCAFDRSSASLQVSHTSVLSKRLRTAA